MIKYLNKCFELDSCNFDFDFDFDLDQHAKTHQINYHYLIKQLQTRNTTQIKTQSSYEIVNIFNEHYRYLTNKHTTLARVAYWIILQTQSNTYYPTPATQELIVQYNYKYREKVEEECFTTSFFFSVSSS